MTTEELFRVAIAYILFPLFFQHAFITFAWGANDIFVFMILKRTFILLPTFSFIVACWATIACAFTVLIRTERSNFINTIVVSWWDLARSYFQFWGGFCKFLYYFVASFFGLAKFLVIGIWMLIQDIIFMPFRLIRSMGENVLNPGVAWIAVFLTVLWTLLEAVIFTNVLAIPVRETFQNITQKSLGGHYQLFLFFFLLVVVMGSYVVLSTLSDCLKNKDIFGTIKIAIIELIVMTVEILFLYREFVDQLAIFLERNLEDFQLGVTGILSIATLAWIGVRGLSWFLFAKHGTPPIMAIIRGTGIRSQGEPPPEKGTDLLIMSKNFAAQIKAETTHIQKMGDELLDSFILPPLQVVAATVNFFTLLLTGEHLFQLPFKSLEEVMSSRLLSAPAKNSSKNNHRSKSSSHEK